MLRVFRAKYIISLLVVLLSVELVFGVDTSVELFDDQSEQVSTDSLDTTNRAKAPAGAFLNDILSGKNTDSLYYDVEKKQVFIYNSGDVTYQGRNLKADYMRLDMNNKEILAYGHKDSTQMESAEQAKSAKPQFVDGGSEYQMDTIVYNLDTAKAKIKGVATQEGDGWLIGNDVKKMDDNTINIRNGQYTTCDHVDHPHFYLAMTKAKVIPGKKVITGPAYLVLAGVPLYPLLLPEGFFPINGGPKSGILTPSYGEDGRRGFFLKDLGYYFPISEHVDLTVRGGFYSLGSWEASAASRYIKRYKYNGTVNINYGNTILGEKGEPDYTNSSDIKIAWRHSQDPKANPGSTFSANVNFTSSGYSKYSTTNLDDILATQTNSSIAYSKSWAGTPFSLSANMSLSQNAKQKTVSMTLPTVVFNASRFYPLKRREAVGKERWYEKISMSYTGKLTNSVSTTEDLLFKPEMFESMKNGIEHSIPVSANFTLLDYINLQPSFNYKERWYAKMVTKEWDAEQNKVVEQAPDYGFYRLYDYSTSLSASTTVYGMLQTSNKKMKLQALRHTLAPRVSMSYTPNFSNQKFGFYQTVQSDSTGRFQTYSPYSVNAYGVPSSGEAMSMSLSLSQSLEAKVLSERDTSGVKKVKIIDDLSLNANYNFLADSMNLSMISASLRTSILGNYGLSLSATLDPYRVSPEGKRYNSIKLPGRLTSTSWSFGYTFNSREDTSQAAINDISTVPVEYTNPFFDPNNTMDPVLRRQYMAQTYYDFTLPWNLSFNYNISYGIAYRNNGTTGYEPVINQSMTLNGSVNITPNFGVSFSGGYDLMSGKMSVSAINFTRDLHCWQMSLVWVPYGTYRSWSFNIGVKAASLADLKYDKSQSMYDLY